MKLTIEDKKILAAGSSFIDERLAGCVKPRDAGAVTENAEELAQRWRALVSNGSESDGFARRLILAGKGIDDIKPILDEIEWDDAVPLPEWMTVIEEFTAMFPFSYEKELAAMPAGVISEADPVPFQHVILPLVTLCRKKFDEKSGNSSSLLTDKALAQWLGHLMFFFEKHLCLSLLSAFDLVRCKDFMPLSRSSILAMPVGKRSDYEEFSRNMLEGGWLAFLKRYPVAARLTATFCEQQSSYFATACRNLEKDGDRIKEIFNAGKETGKVINIEAGLSDYHNGGKSVIEFEFESGLKLYYKPRSSGIDIQWAKMLEWCRAKMPGFDFKAPLHFEGENCCWAENIENASLSSLEEASSFYYRAGGILALIYTLGGTDFHQENLIACGANPVLVDLETILRPLVKQFNFDELPEDQKPLYLSLEGDSVIRTCMLPMWTPLSKDVSRDYGALTPDDNAAYSRREWIDVNTDRMRREQVDRKTNPSPNVAHFNGELTIVKDYKDDLIKGFREFYSMISDNREEFIGAGGPLNFFAKTRMRYLPRNSQIYADMIERLKSPSLLRSGAAFSIEVEGLSKSFLNEVPRKDIHKLWKIFDAERRSLLFMNIPLFEFDSSEYRIFDTAGEICPDYYIKTAIEESERRVEKLCRQDMDFQCDLIVASISCRYPSDSRAVSAGSKTAPEETFEAQPLTGAQYLEEAARVAKQIADRSIIRNDKPQWLTIKYDPIKNHSYIGPVDYTLYEGTAGIGLFLAAYEKATGDRSHHGLAMKCFDEILELIEDKRAAEMAENVSIGYAGGFIGSLFALYNSGIYMAEEKLCAAAKKGLSLFSEKAIDKDQGLDIIAGSAGAILALTAFYDVLKDDRLIDLVRKCGDNLLDRRFGFETWKLWPSSHAYKPLTGFAHGSAGYAAALLKSFALTGDEKFREAAVGAIDYEKTNYYSDYSNWPDYRINRDLAPGTVAFMGGWCSGAPGVGLARLLTLEVVDNDDVRRDIEGALHFTKTFRRDPGARDHLCCGYAGRIDFLLHAARKLNEPELAAEAGRQMSYIVSRSRAGGKYVFTVDETKTVFTPGLFTGLSGVGYTALRMADPEKISTVLVPEFQKI